MGERVRLLALVAVAFGVAACHEPPAQAPVPMAPAAAVEAPRVEPPRPAPRRGATPPPVDDSASLALERQLAACRQLRAGSVVHAGLSGAPVYIYPRVMPEALATLSTGTAVEVSNRSDDWLMVRFDDRRWGPRVGYVHCSRVVAVDSESAPPDAAP